MSNAVAAKILAERYLHAPSYCERLYAVAPLGLDVASLRDAFFATLGNLMNHFNAYAAVRAKPRCTNARLVFSHQFQSVVDWVGCQPGIVVGAKIYPVSGVDPKETAGCSGARLLRPRTERS